MKENEKAMFLNNINSVALIETSKIKILNENAYTPVTIEGLPLIPIYVYPIMVDENTYKLGYKLVLPNIEITPAYTETYTKNSNLAFKTIPNEKLDGQIIYDNENTHTLKKIPKSKEIIISYITSHKRKIYQYASIIDDQIKNNEKTLKKVL